MTREPHIHTPAHDPGNDPTMGTADWWRRNVPREPDWWARVFSQPFATTDARKSENGNGQNCPIPQGLTNQRLKEPENG